MLVPVRDRVREGGRERKKNTEAYWVCVCMQKVERDNDCGIRIRVQGSWLRK